MVYIRKSSLLRIAFKKPYRSNTEIIFNSFNLPNLKQLHAKEMLYDLYYYDHRGFNFNHTYYAGTRRIDKNNFGIFKCKSEFGKRNPYNISLNFCNDVCVLI